MRYHNGFNQEALDEAFIQFDHNNYQVALRCLAKFFDCKESSRTPSLEQVKQALISANKDDRSVKSAALCYLMCLNGLTTSMKDPASVLDVCDSLIDPLLKSIQSKTPGHEITNLKLLFVVIAGFYKASVKGAEKARNYIEKAKKIKSIDPSGQFKLFLLSIQATLKYSNPDKNPAFKKLIESWLQQIKTDYAKIPHGPKIASDLAHTIYYLLAFLARFGCHDLVEQVLAEVQPYTEITIVGTKSNSWWLYYSINQRKTDDVLSFVKSLKNIEHKLHIAHQLAAKPHPDVTLRILEGMEINKLSPERQIECCFVEARYHQYENNSLKGVPCYEKILELTDGLLKKYHEDKKKLPISTFNKLYDEKENWEEKITKFKVRGIIGLMELHRKNKSYDRVEHYAQQLPNIEDKNFTNELFIEKYSSFIRYYLDCEKYKDARTLLRRLTDRKESALNSAEHKKFSDSINRFDVLLRVFERNDKSSIKGLERFIEENPSDKKAIEIFRHVVGNNTLQFKKTIGKIYKKNPTEIRLLIPIAEAKLMIDFREYHKVFTDYFNRVIALLATDNADENGNNGIQERKLTGMLQEDLIEVIKHLEYVGHYEIASEGIGTLCRIIDSSLVNPTPLECFSTLVKYANSYAPLIVDCLQIFGATDQIKPLLPHVDQLVNSKEPYLLTHLDLILKTIGDYHRKKDDYQNAYIAYRKIIDNLASLPGRTENQINELNKKFETLSITMYVKINPREALTWAQNAHKNNENDPDYVIALATCYRVNGMRTTSAKTLDDALIKNPSDPELPLKRIYFYILDGFYDEAYSLAVAFCDKSPDMLSWQRESVADSLAKIANKDRKLINDSFRDFYRKQIEKLYNTHPAVAASTIESVITMARFCRLKRFLSRPISFYSERYPNNISVQTAYSSYLVEFGQANQAVDITKTLTEKHPNNFSVRFNHMLRLWNKFYIQTHLPEQDIKENKENLENQFLFLIDKSPLDIGVIKYYFNYLFVIKQYQAIYDYFQQRIYIPHQSEISTLSHFPPRVYSDWFYACVELKETEEAVNIVKIFIGKMPEEVSFHCLLISHWISNGESEEANNWFTKYKSDIEKAGYLPEIKNLFTLNDSIVSLQQTPPPTQPPMPGLEEIIIPTRTPLVKANLPPFVRELLEALPDIKINDPVVTGPLAIKILTTDTPVSDKIADYVQDPIRAYRYDFVAAGDKKTLLKPQLPRVKFQPLEETEDKCTYRLTIEDHGSHYDFVFLLLPPGAKNDLENQITKNSYFTIDTLMIRQDGQLGLLKNPLKNPRLDRYDTLGINAICRDRQIELIGDNVAQLLNRIKEQPLLVFDTLNLLLNTTASGHYCFSLERCSMQAIKQYMEKATGSFATESFLFFSKILQDIPMTKRLLRKLHNAELLDAFFPLRLPPPHRAATQPWTPQVLNWLYATLDDNKIITPLNRFSGFSHLNSACIMAVLCLHQQGNIASYLNIGGENKMKAYADSISPILEMWNLLSNDNDLPIRNVTPAFVSYLAAVKVSFSQLPIPEKGNDIELENPKDQVKEDDDMEIPDGEKARGVDVDIDVDEDRDKVKDEDEDEDEKQQYMEQPKEQDLTPIPKVLPQGGQSITSLLAPLITQQTKGASVSSSNQELNPTSMESVGNANNGKSGITGSQIIAQFHRDGDREKDSRDGYRDNDRDRDYGHRNGDRDKDYRHRDGDRDRDYRHRDSDRDRDYRHRDSDRDRDCRHRDGERDRGKDRDRYDNDRNRGKDSDRPRDWGRTQGQGNSRRDLSPHHCPDHLFARKPRDPEKRRNFNSNWRRSRSPSPK